MYVNLQGYDGKKDAYIAAQGMVGFTILFCVLEYVCIPLLDTGPVEVSVGRFWRMVWEYGLHTIVMLTQCVEAGKVHV